MSSELRGLIFTYVWAFDQPSDLEYVRGLVGIFERAGGRVVYAELWADLETRLRRNESERRLLEKPFKRDVRSSRNMRVQHEAEHRFTSDGSFSFANHLQIDTTDLSPDEVDARIAGHFALRASTG